MPIKRPLLTMFVGFVLGEVLSLLHVAGVFIVFAVFLAGVLVAAGTFTVKRMGYSGVISSLFSGSRGREWLLLLFFFMAGFFRMEAASGLPPSAELIRALDGEKVSLEGCVTDLNRKGDTISLKLKESRIYEKSQDGGDGIWHPSGTVLLYLKGEEEILQTFREVRLGMRVRAFGEIGGFLNPRNPGEFSYAAYYQSQKIHYRMFGDGLEITDKRYHRYLYHRYLDGLYRLRLTAGDILDRICTETDRGIFKAVLLGDKGDLSDEIRRLYQDSGIAHLLAISGLHISLLGMFVYKGIRRLGAGILSSGVLSGCFIISYGILTGASGSVCRAVFMILCTFLAEYLGRTYDLLSAAALAGICLLVDSPYLLLQGGFQLSFGAVFAIGGIGNCLTNWLPCRYSWQKALLPLVSIQWMTLPVVLYHFYQYPLYGFFINLIVVPLMAFLVGFGMAGMVLGGISTGAGTFAIGAGHWILQLYRFLCLAARDLPKSLLVLGRPDFKQMAVFYVWSMWILAILRLFVKRGKKPFHRWMILAFGVGLSFLFMVKLPAGDRLLVTFLDVGQGDGIVVTTKEANILVDGGSTDVKDLGKSRLEPFLKSRGISNIDYAFVSHGDMDHISGLVYLMEEARGIEIQNLVLPYLGRGDEAYEPLRRLAQERGISVYDMGAGDMLKAGSLQISCLYPGKQEAADDRNEQSLVLKLDFGNCHVLLTGDMSSRGEEKLLKQIASHGREKKQNQPAGPVGMDQEELREIQVLKVAHHGSKYSSSEEFLQSLMPQWAVFSYGEDNRYGHPHQEAVKRMEEQGVMMYHTAEQGAVTLRSDGERVWWEVFVE